MVYSCLQFNMRSASNTLEWDIFMLRPILSSSARVIVKSMAAIADWGLTEVEFLASGKILYSNVECKSHLCSIMNQDNDKREISSHAKSLSQQ